MISVCRETHEIVYNLKNFYDIYHFNSSEKFDRKFVQLRLILEVLMNALLSLLLVLVLAATAAASQPSSQRLTIQQNGQAFVSETWTHALPVEKGQVRLEGLAPNMDPHSLVIRSTDGHAALKILGLIHEPPLSGPSALLKAHVGQTLSIVIPDGAARDGRVRKQARLLSADEAPLFLVDGQIYAGPVESIHYPVQPVGPSPRVTLAYANAGPEKRTLEAQYVTGGLGWRMDYDLTADAGFTKARLDGYASITNNSGLPYPSVRVELLAGDVRQASGKRMLARASAPMLAMQEDAVGTAPEALFEHHLYKLPGLLSLPEQGLVRFPLAQSNAVSVSRRLVARASAVPSGRTAEPMAQSVQTLISFRNIGAEGLGQPLPKGVIRVYQSEGSGQSDARRLVGEADLDRVAAGAKAEISLGQAFDLTLERTAMSYERTGKNSFKGAWDITLRNSKAEAATVVIQESFPGKWKVTQSSHKVARSTARTAEFEILVPPTGEGQPLVLSYSFTVDM